MSIYSGSPIEQAYAHGRDDGYAYGEADIPLGLGTVSEWMRCAKEDVVTAGSRESRAFALGYLRGYREAVRTLHNGRWGV